MQLTKIEKKILWATAAIAATCLIIITILWLRIKSIAKSTTINSFTDMTLPRGYRNNNPLNIRKSNESWLGKVSPNTDGTFEQFETMGYGYRAALKLIRNYIGKGYNTIERIISRWAPANENNTTSYINNVASRTGINKSRIIAKDDAASLKAIVKAMSISENGTTYTGIDNDIEAGWRMI